MAANERQVVQTDQAPKAIGPYSQAILAGGMVYASGQVGLDPTTGALVDVSDIVPQVRRGLDNLRAVLEAAGSDLAHVVKTTVFLVDMNDFTTMNEIYATYFTDAPPARSTVAVHQLPRGARFEIECIALVK
ncbi:MAG: RidA family protein [Ktedonobacterales bacterium]|nr:RidA family protein [Ktedonobacterales bacterium]